MHNNVHEPVSEKLVITQLSSVVEDVLNKNVKLLCLSDYKIGAIKALAFGFGDEFLRRRTDDTPLSQVEIKILKAEFDTGVRNLLVEMSRETSQSRRSVPKLTSPPGSLARCVLAFVFSKKTFNMVFAQSIADMRDEHAEALSEGRLWKARWVVLAYYLDLSMTLASWFGTSVVTKVVGLWKIGL